MLASAVAFCLFNPVIQAPSPPATIKGCLLRMKELCAKHALDWNNVFVSGTDTIKTHYTEKFVALELVGKDNLELRYKLRSVRDAASSSEGKAYAWNDRGITVYQVPLKGLDENKITPSKKLSFRSDVTEPTSKYAYVFVLSDDMTSKVKVTYEDAHDSFKINGVAQTGEDSGTYSRPPRDTPSRVLNVTSVEDAREVADLLKTMIELAKKG